MTWPEVEHLGWPSTVKTVIDGYSVSLDPDSESWDRCWIKVGPFSGSLVQLLEHGFLSDAIDVTRFSVPADIVERIHDWATEHGFAE